MYLCLTDQTVILKTALSVSTLLFPPRWNWCSLIQQLCSKSCFYEGYKVQCLFKISQSHIGQTLQSTLSPFIMQTCHFLPTLIHRHIKQYEICWVVLTWTTRTHTSDRNICCFPVSSQCERGKGGGHGQAAADLPRGEKGKVFSRTSPLSSLTPGTGDSQRAAGLSDPPCLVPGATEQRHPKDRCSS